MIQLNSYTRACIVQSENEVLGKKIVFGVIGKIPHGGVRTY